MKTKNENIETHLTSNLYEASFLMAKGFKIKNTIPNGRKHQILLEGIGIKKATLEYYDGGLISGKALTDAYRTLKDLVFQ